ncbi:MAG: hypothetical protein AABY64_14405 [Bdellovibrionota bacterium]
MENLKNPSVMGKKIYKYLDKDKILLLQDKSFPNIISKIIGDKISGSWWGHPLANPIYNGLVWLEHNRNVLIVKLLDGKVTYVHESLFSDFYSVVSKTRDWQLAKLKSDELSLLKYVSKKNKVLSDDSKLKELVEDSKKSLAALEKKLLLYSSEEHTESGKHIKEFTTWKKSKIFTKAFSDYELAKSKINRVVDKLSEESGARVKLPWS